MRRGLRLQVPSNPIEIEMSESYLSPEAMLQDPKWVKEEAQGGFSAPTYAYARNNPLSYVDKDGLGGATPTAFFTQILKSGTIKG